MKKKLIDVMIKKRILSKEVYDPDVNDANCRAMEKAYAECKDMNDILN